MDRTFRSVMVDVIFQISRSQYRVYRLRPDSVSAMILYRSEFVSIVATTVFYAFSIMSIERKSEVMIVLKRDHDEFPIFRVHSIP